MSGGKFSVSLREVLNSENFLKISSFVKENINFWEEDIFINNDFEETAMKIEKEMSPIMTQISEIELSEDSEQVTVYIPRYVVRKIKKHLKCHVCNNKIISNDNDVENDEYLKTLSWGGLIVPFTTFKDFVCQTFSMLELISPIIEQVTENNSVAAVSNTVLMKLEYGSADFSCEQYFKKSKSISVRTIINIFYCNKQKITNEGVRERF